MSQSEALATLVGGMKVEAFARLAGLGVEELVALLLDPTAPAPSRASLGTRARAVVRGSRSPAIAAAPLVAPDDPPSLADMIDRATYRQIHNAVDRWYVINVMNEEGGNLSRVARRLRVSRKRVRALWARLRANAGKKILKARGKPSNAPPPPDIVPLLPKGTYREVHDTVDRWLLGHTLARVDGNVSQAARDLAVSRKHLRDHLARVKLYQ